MSVIRYNSEKNLLKDLEETSKGLIGDPQMTHLPNFSHKNFA